MSFLSGKIGFRAASLRDGYSLKNLDEILSFISDDKQRYKEIDTKTERTFCIVSPDDEIKDDFKQGYSNPGNARFILFDILVQERKIDKKLFKRKYERALENRKSILSMTVAKPKIDSATRKEIRADVMEELLPQSPISLKRHNVCIDLENNLIIIGSKSLKAYEMVLEYIRPIVTPSSSETSPFMIRMTSELSKHDIENISPFAVINGADISKEPSDLIRQFLVWLILEDLEGKEMVADSWVKIEYSASSKDKSTLQVKSDNECMTKFLFENFAETGIPDEVEFCISSEILGFEGVWPSVKVDSSGYISGINIGLDKGIRKESPEIAMEFSVKIHNYLSGKADKFFTTRCNKASWVEESLRIRNLIQLKFEDLGIDSNVYVG